MATTEMNCLASGGGGALKEVDGSFTSASGNVNVTVSGLSQIMYIRYDRAAQGGSGHLWGAADLLIDDTLYNLNSAGGSYASLGVTSISNNTFTFSFDAVNTITYTAVGY